MFEGKELEYKIGDYGSASADIDGKGVVEIAVAVRIDLIAEVEKLAAKTATPIDNQVIAWLKLLMGRV